MVETLSIELEQMRNIKEQKSNVKCFINILDGIYLLKIVIFADLSIKE
jgi:hypothetical protein